MYPKSPRDILLMKCNAFIVIFLAFFYVPQIAAEMNKEDKIYYKGNEIFLDKKINR